MMNLIEHNRPDIATGERIMKGHKWKTYPTIPVTQAKPEKGDRVSIISLYGHSANMTVEAFRATCYPAEYVVSR